MLPLLASKANFSQLGEKISKITFSGLVKRVEMRSAVATVNNGRKKDVSQKENQNR